MYSKINPLLPVDNCTHVQTNILERPRPALLHGVQVSQLVVHMNQLHAALEGSLCGGRAGVLEVACKIMRQETGLRKMNLKRLLCARCTDTISGLYSATLN